MTTPLSATPATAQPAALLLLKFASAMLGQHDVREDDGHPLPPGPWDPIIRTAIDSAGLDRLGPYPEPWRQALAALLARHPEAIDAIGRAPDFGDMVALNPQPLPPRWRFLIRVAQGLAERTELLQDLAAAVTRQGEEQGIIIVSGYTAKFTEDFCGTDFRLRWPMPGPRPKWFEPALDSVDLLVMATQFDAAARRSFHPGLKRSLLDAGLRFANAGAARFG